MSASLIYHCRRGFLATVAAGKTFYLPTYPTPSSVHVWQKVQEIRVGKVTLWDHCFELPHVQVGRGGAIDESTPVGPVTHRIGIETAGTEKLEVYDYPGDFAQRFDGVNPGGGRIPHLHPGRVVYVGGQRSGMHIHGWPPCNLETCVLVTQQWDQLFEAIALEKELSFSIAQ